MHVCQRLHHLAPSQAGILADRKLAIPDDGFAPTSAIEIATKLASRELAFKVCGVETSPSLDDGDRCKGINEDAYALALNVSSKEALKRFQKLGRPLVMTSDQKPVPPAGPWWIWKYLKFTDQGSEVDITSLYAFYPLSGPAYGAGNHYCKLLSPARVLEWIYVDGLRPVRTNMSSIIVWSADGVHLHHAGQRRVVEKLKSSLGSRHAPIPTSICLLWVHSYLKSHITWKMIFHRPQTWKPMLFEVMPSTVIVQSFCSLNGDAESEASWVFLQSVEIRRRAAQPLQFKIERIPSKRASHLCLNWLSNWI